MYKTSIMVFLANLITYFWQIFVRHWKWAFSGQSTENWQREPTPQDIMFTSGSGFFIKSTPIINPFGKLTWKLKKLSSCFGPENLYGSIIHTLKFDVFSTKWENYAYGVLDSVITEDIF